MTMTVILMLGEIRVLAELKLLHGQSIIKVVGGIIVWNGTEIELEHCGCESRPIYGCSCSGILEPWQLADPQLSC